MSAAKALAETPRRKPPGSLDISGAPATIPTLAWPRAIHYSDLSRTARQVWMVLCDLRSVQNFCYPTLRFIAERCQLSIRTIQRAMEELQSKSWICSPEGKAGGRPSNKRGKDEGSVLYHLHPDGMSCGLAKTERQPARRTRPDVAERNRKRARAEIATPVKAHNHDKLSCFSAVETMTTCHTFHFETMTSAPKNHDICAMPYKEVTAKNCLVAAAAAAFPTRIREPDAGNGELTPNELSEIKRIEQRTGVRIDGLDALRLKAGVEQANLTLAHLRWFLRDERFVGARSPTAVLLTIARDFRERVKGIEWPECLDEVPDPSTRPGLTAEEIVLL